MVNYSHITPEAGMVMKMSPVTIPPSGRVLERAPEPPEMGSVMAATTELFVDGGLGIQGFPEKMYK